MYIQGQGRKAPDRERGGWQTSSKPGASGINKKGRMAKAV